MLETFDTPNRQRGITQIIRAGGITNSATQNWQPIHKPRGMTMCAIWMCGSGAGGGGGCGGAGGAAKGGGGGGGGAAALRALVLADMLPDLFYAQVPQGGAGGPGGSSASGTAGTAGGLSVLAYQPETNANLGNIIFRSGNAAAAGGGAGTAAAAGALGAAGTIGTNATVGLGALCSAISLQFYAGTAGVAGGVHTGAAGASVTLSANSVSHTGGAGGAGCTTTEFAGGAQTGIQRWPTLPGGTSGGGAGSGGIEDWLPGVIIPFSRRGGTGGGSSNSTTGGQGGNGATGCGGAGGGAGVTVGGAGGRGGDGIVVISWW